MRVGGDLDKTGLGGGTARQFSRHKTEDLGHIQQIWPEYEMCKEALLNLLERHPGY